MNCMGSSVFHRIISGFGLVLVCSFSFPDFLWADDSDANSSHQETVNEQNDVYTLPPVKVVSTPLQNQGGKQVLSLPTLEKLPLHGETQLDALAVVPRVQFSDEENNEKAAGEILPPLISISGGRVYDNLLTVDGLNVGSRTDPIQDSDRQATLPRHHPQGLFVDNWLLETTEVYTHNIPPRFGGFTGGAVRSETVDPDHEAPSKLRFRTTNDRWTEQHGLEDVELSDSENTDQPRFDKYFLDGLTSFSLTDSTDILVGAGYKRSNLQIWDNRLSYGNLRKEDRTQHSLFTKSLTRLEDGREFRFFVLYAPYEEDKFIPGNLNSEHTFKIGGGALNGQYSRPFSDGTMDVRLGQTWSQSSREAPSHYYQWRRAGSSKDWGTSTFSNEGWYGDIDTESWHTQFSLDVEREAPSIGSVTQNLTFGVQASREYALYDRKETSYLYRFTSSGTVDCAGDTETCEDGVQYANRRFVYSEGEANATIHDVALYGQDTLQWDRLTVRPGFRVGYDDFRGNLNLDHRFSTEYDLWGDNSTVITAGLNRYHGSYLMAFALREGIPPLTEQTRSLGAGDIPGAWSTDTPATSTLYTTSDLKTPYSNELALGVQQELLGGLFSIDWVQRKYRDEYARESVKVKVGGKTQTTYFLNNNGHRNYQSISASWERNWRRHSFLLELIWQEQEGSKEDYLDIVDLEDLEDIVVFQGELIAKIDLPRNDFNRAWKGLLVYSVDLPFDLTFSNITTYRSGYLDVYDTKENTSDGYDIYDVRELDPNIQFDWKVQWRRVFSDTSGLLVSLEIYNVLDRVELVGDDSDDYEIGRQFWLGLETWF